VLARKAVVDRALVGRIADTLGLDPDRQVPETIMARRQAGVLAPRDSSAGRIAGGVSAQPVSMEEIDRYLDSLSKS